MVMLFQLAFVLIGTANGITLPLPFDPSVPDCFCPAVEDPVCCDGQTYRNSCEASCAGFEESDCFCTKEYAPICCNGQTYGNQCMAECDGFGSQDCTSEECD
eukprot:TRINITY_DN1497_c0_g1_i16.p4 TRINITY_DN1497_c0_g1~~TRINITY_DN1497_c0_g1_i16.p4  ORF type:complete len:102 (-),score=7.11 TRINITY_DN1497_c0_g1_i16:516-821(-)